MIAAKVTLNLQQMLMQGFKYNIGGEKFSHYEVEMAILRAHMNVPDNGIRFILFRNSMR